MHKNVTAARTRYGRRPIGCATNLRIASRHAESTKGGTQNGVLFLKCGTKSGGNDDAQEFLVER